MGAAIEKTLIFPAPEPVGECTCLVWDEQPRSTPGGGARRPFVWIPSLQDGAITVIHFHANAEDLYLIEDHLRRLSIELGANVLGVEYPGYGPLQTASAAESGMGTPTTAGIDAVAAHALQYVVLVQGIPPSQVLLYGRSLGCGPALRLARRARDLFRWGICGLVLQSPFISVKQLAADYIGRAGSLVIPECYNNLQELEQLCSAGSSGYCPVGPCVPILFLHGKKDSIVKPYHSETLHQAAIRCGHRGVELTICTTATHDCWDLQTDLVNPISDFLERHPGPKIKDTKVMPRSLNCANVMCSVQSCRPDRAESRTLAPATGTLPGPLWGLGSLIPGF